MRGAGHQGGRAWVALSIGVLTAIADLPAALAQSTDQGAGPDPAYGWREIYGGVDVASAQWLFYSGATIAPFSKDVFSNGWRFRFGGGYGQYSYDTRGPHTDAPQFDARRDGHVRGDRLGEQHGEHQQLEQRARLVS